MVLCERLLPVEDRGNRYVLSACGLFLDALERAGDAAGLEVDVEPTGRRRSGGAHARRARSCSATVRVTRAASRATRRSGEVLVRRRTSRLPYDGHPVAAERIEELQAIARVVRTPAARRQHRRAGSTGCCAQNVLGDHRQPPDPRRPEGDLAVDAARPHPRPRRRPVAGAARTSRRGSCGSRSTSRGRCGCRGSRTGRSAATSGPRPGTRHVALLCGPFDTLARARHGRAALLAALWTAMAMHGISLHPYGSTLTNAFHARRVAERFGADDGWLLLRFGTSTEPPAVAAARLGGGAMNPWVNRPAGWLLSAIGGVALSSFGAYVTVLHSPVLGAAGAEHVRRDAGAGRVLPGPRAGAGVPRGSSRSRGH